MSYRRRAGGGKRDTAEGPILSALAAVGARTWRLSGTGNPDVLCLFRGRYYVAEVKSGKAGRLTANQQDIPWPIWRSPQDALLTLGL